MLLHNLQPHMELLKDGLAEADQNLQGKQLHELSLDPWPHCNLTSFIVKLESLVLLLLFNGSEFLILLIPLPCKPQHMLGIASLNGQSDPAMGCGTPSNPLKSKSETELHGINRLLNWQWRCDTSAKHYYGINGMTNLALASHFCYNAL